MDVFPHHPKLFDAWCKAISRCDITSEKRQNYRVCDVHFSEEQKFVTPRNKTNLKALSVPSINLPSRTSYEVVAERMEEIALPSTSKNKSPPRECDFSFESETFTKH
ncbi:hypothetical protein FQR65_LT15455 [Abscondita terminalis]|nr:hypothetical protein FQR65_LT15455 [Abscondita terminalis]